MRLAFFKAFGIVVLLIDLPLLTAAIAEISFYSKIPSPSHIRWTVAVGFAWFVGLGLLGLRKWAALYFSIPLFCFGLWLALTSIEPIRFPWNLFYMAEGVSLMMPLAITIRLWSRLSWGGKWFF
jgi:hypothetical protein